MFKRIFSALLSAVLAALLPACDGINLEKLVPGVTTMAQTREIMGPAEMEWQDTDGLTTWEYPRTPYGMVNYMIDFNPDRTVRAVRQVLTEENMAKVSPGMRREEIRRLLGKPASEQYFSLKKEYVWDWKTKVEASQEIYFDVYFDTTGRVTRTGSHWRTVSGK